MSRSSASILVLLFLATPLAAQERLTPELLWSFGRVSAPRVSPDGSTVVYGVRTYDIGADRGNTDLYRVAAAGGDARRITAFRGSEAGARWRPDGRKIGFLSSESGSVQLWEMNPDGSDKRQVTHVEGGISNFLYSPDGSHISFTRDVKLDSTVNELYPDLPKADARIIDDLMYRHWDRWHDYAYSHLFVAPYRDGRLVGEAVDVMADEPYDTPLSPFGGVEQIAWRPDGGAIAYTSKKLTGAEYATSTDSDIYLYELDSGRTLNLTDGMDGYDMEPVFGPGGGRVAWLSMERPGYESDRNRIFVLELGTGERWEVTRGFDRSAATVRWAPDGETIYFLAVTEGTEQIFSADPRPGPGDGRIEKLTEGVHNYTGLEPAGEGGRLRLIAPRMSMSMPTEIYRVDPGSGEAEQLTFTNDELLDRIEMGRVEERWIEATDGERILTWVIYPPGFDPSRSYPALLYAQGGPQSPVSQFFSYRWNFQIMAAHDYVVVAPNRRGLPGFGQEWTDAIRGDWGGQAMQDLLSAIDQVAAEPWVDEERLGAVGASFGGYSVFWLAGNHDGRFRALIAHDGVFHLEAMYGATEELFFVNRDLEGPYWKEPAPVSYREHSPHLYAGRWDTPILVIHGEKDFRVPVTEGMQAFTAARAQGIPARFLYFPEENHWVLSAQNGILWQRVFFDWLDRWLEPTG